MEWSEDRGEVELKGEGGEMKMEVMERQNATNFHFTKRITITSS